MYKVIIIDDEPWTRDVIKSLGMWKKWNMEVVGEASDGETGWILIRNVLPDIIITDVKMPRINGLDLIAMMRKENILAPVIVISGYDDYDYVHKALKLGVVDYLLKPIKPEDLNAQLESSIDKIRKNNLSNQSEIRAEFLSEELERDCRRLLEKLSVGLQLRSQEEIDDSFEELAEIVYGEGKKNPPQSIQIGIYYEVLSVLQKYIEQMGYQRDEVLSSLNECYVFSRENTLYDMMQFFAKVFHQTIDYIDDQMKKKNRIDTEAIVRYLDEHYTEGITLEETADYFHISKEYLSKIFKNDRKIGFSDYILKLRMERARELIQFYDAPLKEVGFLVGYVDLAHFYKTFKKYFGITPGDMKKSLKKDNEM